MRLAAASAALLLLAAVPAAADHRADRCPGTVVDDQRGLVESTAGAPWRDLHRAALGSDGRQVTAALALAALPATPSTPQHALVDYTLRFTVQGATAFLTAPAHEGAEAVYGVEIGFRPIVLGSARVVRDPARREIRVTAPIAGFSPHVDLRRGRTATNLNALVSLTPAVPGTTGVVRARTLVVDGADGDATYELGTRSCVPVGR